MNSTDFPAGQRGSFQRAATRSFTLPSRYYHDPETYRRELQQIFYRSWVYLGHAGQLPRVGDYFVDRVADQCLLVLRSDESSIRAFFNVCQHRGHELLSGHGHIEKRITCPYHAWTYGLDGSLYRAPHTEDLDCFDPADFGLREIRLANCAGLLFANLAPGAEHFEDEYAGLEQTFVDYAPGLAEFVTAEQFYYDIAANWKIVVDNFSEGYHIPVAHKRLSKVLDITANNESIVEARFACYKSRSKTGFPGLELTAGDAYLSWTLWPNTCLLSLPGCANLIVIRMSPASPTRCLERVDLLIADGEPEDRVAAIKSLFAEYFNQEDIALVESVQRGLQSLGYDQGRYVVDANEAWYSESGLHRFHLQVIQALEQT